MSAAASQWASQSSLSKTSTGDAQQPLYEFDLGVARIEPRTTIDDAILVTQECFSSASTKLMK
jgi:hypothetical protein